jgi:hypothetical protein
MATSTAKTVSQYLASLPADRRAAIARVRGVVNANIPAGFQECMQYGMISWVVPLSRCPDTYNGQPLGIVSLAAQKNYNALYLMSVYGDPKLEAWFRKAFAAAGKKLDMGKSCVRFKTLDALPLDVIGQTVGKVSVDELIRRATAVGAAKKSTKRTPARSARTTRGKQRR